MADAAGDAPRVGSDAFVGVVCPLLVIAWSADDQPARVGGQGGPGADPTNRCAASDPPASLSMTQQRLVCLDAAHVDCPRFVRAMGPGRGGSGRLGRSASARGGSPAGTGSASTRRADRRSGPGEAAETAVAGVAAGLAGAGLAGAAGGLAGAPAACRPSRRQRDGRPGASDDARPGCRRRGRPGAGGAPGAHRSGRPPPEELAAQWRPAGALAARTAGRGRWHPRGGADRRPRIHLDSGWPHPPRWRAGLGTASPSPSAAVSPSPSRPDARAQPDADRRADPVTHAEPDPSPSVAASPSGTPQPSLPPAFVGLKPCTDAPDCYLYRVRSGTT